MSEKLFAAVTASIVALQIVFFLSLAQVARTGPVFA